MGDKGKSPSDPLLGSHFLGPGPGLAFSSLQQAPGVYLVLKRKPQAQNAVTPAKAHDIKPDLIPDLIAA